MTKMMAVVLTSCSRLPGLATSAWQLAQTKRELIIDRVSDAIAKLPLRPLATTIDLSALATRRTLSPPWEDEAHRLPTDENGSYDQLVSCCLAPSLSVTHTPPSVGDAVPGTSSLCPKDGSSCCIDWTMVTGIAATSDADHRSSNPPRLAGSLVRRRCEAGDEEEQERSSWLLPAKASTRAAGSEHEAPHEPPRVSSMSQLADVRLLLAVLTLDGGGEPCAANQLGRVAAMLPPSGVTFARNELLKLAAAPHFAKPHCIGDKRRCMCAACWTDFARPGRHRHPAVERYRMSLRMERESFASPQGDNGDDALVSLILQFPEAAARWKLGGNSTVDDSHIESLEALATK